MTPSVACRHDRSKAIRGCPCQDSTTIQQCRQRSGCIGSSTGSPTNRQRMRCSYSVLASAFPSMRERVQGRIGRARTRSRRCRADGVGRSQVSLCPTQQQQCVAHAPRTDDTLRHLRSLSTHSPSALVIAAAHRHLAVRALRPPSHPAHSQSPRLALPVRSPAFDCRFMALAVSSCSDGRVSIGAEKAAVTPDTWRTRPSRPSVAIAESTPEGGHQAQPAPRTRTPRFSEDRSRDRSL